ncbi:hypothetical protein CRENBAI_011801 [Crenichthys baileyi]|uniref:Adenosine 3'-phospho 5'-phosphosulfate transporter 2 n=1 Tax=Crenichthys baileyi TaxID=28760 RepID=A0AAV9SE97_9TELE
MLRYLHFSVYISAETGHRDSRQVHMDSAKETSAATDTMSAKYGLVGYNSSRKHISISIPSSTEVMSPHIKSVEELRVLGINLSNLSAPTQFFICVAGVFFFYLVYGYLQELIFSVEGFKPFGWYLTLVQFGFYSMFGLVELQFTQDKRRRIPGKTYMMIAFLTVGTMGLSNTSLGYLNYPTQGNVKLGMWVCCSLYESRDHWGFSLADSKVAPNFNVTGAVTRTPSVFIYISGGLLCVGGLGPAVAFLLRGEYPIIQMVICKLQMGLNTHWLEQGDLEHLVVFERPFVLHFHRHAVKWQRLASTVGNRMRVLLSVILIEA